MSRDGVPLRLIPLLNERTTGGGGPKVPSPGEPPQAPLTSKPQDADRLERESNTERGRFTALQAFSCTARRSKAN